MRNCTLRWDTLAQKGYISWLKRECSALERKKTIHFFIRICSCVKDKPPHIKPVAPLGIITITHPMVSN